MSRYPPPARDRSPPRYDRRPSSTYPSTGPSYRGQTDSAPLTDRGVPRGPKADFRGGTSSQFSPASRGRGAFPARPTDTRDRDRERERERDARPAPQSYRGRDDDRADWPRRDREFASTDRGVALGRETRPYAARDRSASPIRARRDSRDSVASNFGRPSESTPSYYPPATRGGLGRGRGRGDWESRRGRPSFVGERERDLFHPRSRSRESWRDRDFERGRPPASEVDRVDRYDRRDYDRSREREVRPREYDTWPRDQSPAKSSIGNAAAPVATPSTSVADRPAKSDNDAGKRASLPTPGSAIRDSRRDGEPSDYFGALRADTVRRDAPSSEPKSAAPAGLDYGPPPSVPTTSTPAMEKAAPLKPQAQRTETGTTLANFQPPSAPKAARTFTAASLSQTLKTPQLFEGWSRTETGSRPGRPAHPQSTNNTSNEATQKKDEYVAEPKPPVAPAADRSMPPNVPSGPRLSNAPAYKPRLPSTEPPAAAIPPATPREPSKPAALDSRAPVIPTGPRHDREVSRPLPGTGSKLWVSPEYKPKPSIMNAMNKPYQLDSRDRPAFTPMGPRQQAPFHSPPDKARALQGSFASMPSAPSGPKAMMSTSPRTQETKITLLPPRHALDDFRQSEDVEMSVPVSSEEEDEAEDDSFDEDYFAESEERFRQEMDLLEARKPPPLLQDGAIVSLLIKLQFIEMISQDNLPRPTSSPVAVSKDESQLGAAVGTGLPSPEGASNEADGKMEEDEVEVTPFPKGRPLRQRPVNPIPTPPLEDLPYFKAEPAERVVFEDSDNEVEHEAVNILLQQEFERSAWDWRSDLDDVHGEFRRKYPSWKQEVSHLEQERRELQASPAPASPAPSIAPSVTPSLTHERTRGARNTTEADLQAAILMSQQSLKEEEERREREAASNSLPNYDTEAVVPLMLKPAEVELSKFEDTNRLVPEYLAFDIFSFLPPEDDFTDEEQVLFTAAYCQNPKKWGKIADTLPDRTYQDCIIHYYLTKNHAHYKDIWRRSQPRKRRGRAANKPRSTALMSELVYGDESESVPIPVTDSGRPRRAAAPTFGDAASEADSSTPAPQSKKLTSALKDGSAEPVAMKTARGRKAGIATKTRRTKAQIQADQLALPLSSAPEPSPAKPLAGAKAERGRTLLRAENLPGRSEAPPLLQVQRPIDVAMQQYPVLDMAAAMTQVAPNPIASQVTSYWSVPEQHKFPELLAYYGRDFAAISEFMKTKSVTMIKNYYLRQINDGKDDFEKLGEIGDQNRTAGKVLGQPPSPIAPAKRVRSEVPPSLASGARNPNLVEQTLVEADATVPVMKSGIIEEFPRNTVERTATGEIVSNSRQAIRETNSELPLTGPPSSQSEEMVRMANERASLYGQKPLHGPRSGLFREDPMGFQSSRHAIRHSLEDRTGQLHPHVLSDLPRTEPSQPPSTSYGVQSAVSHQEREAIALARPQNPSLPLARGGPPSQVDKYGQQSLFGPGRSRNNSSATPSHAGVEGPQDFAALRRLESQRPIFGRAGAGSPAPPSSVLPASQLPRTEVSQYAAASPAAEPVKPPTKRSNLFGLLNNDPYDPPPKRPSLEAPRRQSILSPQFAHISEPQSLLQQTRSQSRPDDNAMNRAVRGSYGQSGALQTAPAQQPAGEFQSGFSNTAATDPSNDPWMARYDPRPQGAPSEQRSHHHSPAPSHYSVIPPASQQSGAPPLHSLRAETPRTLDRTGMDHRRTLLTGIGQIPHAPSPPPQQPAQNVQQYRSASGTSQHSRVSSIGYASAQTGSQPTSLGHQQGAQGHPPSAGSTPVPGLHQRGQPSLDFQPRLTIQQHMAQQNQQKQQEQQREHERQLQRQREVEMAQREREREHQQQQHLLRRDGVYGIDHHPSPSISRQTQPGTTSTQSHMAFAQREIPRTFTPPLSHTHSQYSGPGAAALGLHHGLQTQHQHQHQHQSQHPTRPGPTQPQSTAQPTSHPLHHLHQQQQQPQPQVLGAAAHFRGLSQGGESRREERR